MINDRKNKTVFVILLNWNTAAVTLECIHSILKSDYPAYSICLIDNGSRKQELDILQNGLPPEVELHLLKKNLGYVGGINYALKEAKKAEPDYILIMNNDTIIHPDAMKHLVSTAQKHNNQCLVTGKVMDYKQKDLIQQIGSKLSCKRFLVFEPIADNQIDEGQYDIELEQDMIDDVFWLLPYNVFTKLGYYNPRFWFNREQADYAIRATRAGNKLIYTPKAKIWHIGSHSIGGRELNPIREYFDVKSILMLRYLHLRRLDFMYFYFIQLFSVCKNIMCQLVKHMLGKPNSLRIQIARLIGMICFTIMILNHLPETGKYPKILDTRLCISSKRSV